MALYVIETAVRKRLNKQGKLCSPTFLHMLDKFIERKIDRAVNVHNGGKKTVDAAVAEFIGLHS